MKNPWHPCKYGIDRSIKRTERLTVWVDEELKKSLQSMFDENLSDGLREVLKLGLLVIDPSQLVIRNRILGIEIPLTNIGRVQLKDERALRSLENLRRIGID